MKFSKLTYLYSKPLGNHTLKIMKTRLHSSRMCTTHSLTVSPSMLCIRGGGVPGPRGGVPGPGGVYLAGGVPGPGGCTWSGGVPGPRGVSAPGVPGPGGVSAPGPGWCQVLSPPC